MTYQTSYRNSQQEKTMTEEQFNQIIDAILSGKYSWACVLLLRFAGHNPLHYIPYRTYNRLMKEHGPNRKSQTQDIRDYQNSQSKSQQKQRAKISDLAYLEPMAEKCSAVSGGSRNLEEYDNVYWMFD